MATMATNSYSIKFVVLCDKCSIGKLRRNHLQHKIQYIITLLTIEVQIILHTYLVRNTSM